MTHRVILLGVLVPGARRVGPAGVADTVAAAVAVVLAAVVAAAVVVDDAVVSAAAVVGDGVVAAVATAVVVAE